MLSESFCNVASPTHNPRMAFVLCFPVQMDFIFGSKCRTFQQNVVCLVLNLLHMLFSRGAKVQDLVFMCEIGAER